MLALQKEALELVVGFPGTRKDVSPAQVEALLRIDARIEPVLAQLTQQYTTNYQKSTDVESRLWHAVFDLVKAFTAAYQLALKARVSERRQQALARGAAVDPGAARVLQEPRRQVPAVPLRPLDPGAVARAARALRIRADAGMAARAAGLRRGHVRAARGLRRARIPEDAAADAARFRQLHAGPGRVGGAPARGLVAVADAGAAAGRAGGVLRRSHRHPGPAAPGPRVRRRPRAVPRRRPRLRAGGRADALAARARRGRAEEGRAARARAETAADAARVAVRTGCHRPRAAGHPLRHRRRGARGRRAAGAHAVRWPRSTASRTPRARPASPRATTRSRRW